MGVGMIAGVCGPTAGFKGGENPTSGILFGMSTLEEAEFLFAGRPPGGEDKRI
ncbi:hypothetical protein BRCON_0177 [Candidatus Sumerlaea chitinivorans]|uniref:Uncharacterized protein n=1 Tax=Sumerlaea chitinivorans TaxID=2250252 RepID=A0A2Z4Y1P9_SUMC1|nr:hypothetical protein BRCON_0177 [Candidatus Sumerlaea chitinivorans]